MELRHLTSRLTATLTTVAVAGTALAATTAPAQAAERQPGNKSLASVLAADGAGFDKTPGDFDILDNAIRAVLEAKPKSRVKVLANGKVRLTAFAPTDAAFRRLVGDLTGKRYVRERRVFGALANQAGIDTVERVLLYHVVPGATITYKRAKASNGAKLETALGKTVRVKVRNGRVVLVDKDPNDANAKVVVRLRNINQGNKQIAHGIDQVLRPVNL